MITIAARRLSGELLLKRDFEAASAVAKVRLKAKHVLSRSNKDGLITVRIIYGERMLADSDTFGDVTSAECSVLFSHETLSDTERSKHLRFLQSTRFTSRAFMQLPSVARADRAIVIAAIRNNWEIFRYADSAIQCRRSVAKKAVKRMGMALKYARDGGRSDKKLVVIAVRNCGAALQFARGECKADPEIALAAVKADPCALEFVSAERKADRALVLAAVGLSGKALQHADVKFQSDREVVLQAVHQSGEALQYAACAMRQDPDVVSVATKQSPEALQYVERADVCQAVDGNTSAARREAESEEAQLVSSCMDITHDASYCSSCKGFGQRRHQLRGGKRRREVTCATCRGTGWKRIRTHR